MNAIIEAYGLYWKEEDVYWKSGRHAGSLWGVPKGARTSEPVDFGAQAGIYVLYSGHDLVYVGQAGSGKAMLFNRLKAHRRDQLAGRWDKFSWFGLRRVLGSGKLGPVNKRAKSSFEVALNQIEAVMIASAEPSLNKQGGRFGKGRKFLQMRDDRLGLTHQEMIKFVYEKLKNEAD